MLCLQSLCLTSRAAFFRALWYARASGCCVSNRSVSHLGRHSFELCGMQGHQDAVSPIALSHISGGILSSFVVCKGIRMLCLQSLCLTSRAAFFRALWYARASGCCVSNR